MNDDYYEKFPPTGFPGSGGGFHFPVGDLLDHPSYIEKHPVRQWEIEQAGHFLGNFEAGRESRQRRLADLLKQGHRDNTVLAMTLNHGFSELLRNWIASCDRHGIEVRSWTLVVALDEQTAEIFESLGFRVFYPGQDYGIQATAAAGEYGDRTFRDMMFPKNAVVQDLLEMGYDVLFQDVDVVWLKDPVPFLQAPGRQMLEAQFMYDGPNALFAPLHVNSGFFHLRNTKRTRAFWKIVLEQFDKVYHYSGQQRVVNIVLLHHYFRGLKLDVLGEADFANGHLFTWDDVSGLPTDPYVIHNSWTRNIEHKMKKYHLAGIWYL